MSKYRVILTMGNDKAGDCAQSDDLTQCARWISNRIAPVGCRFDIEHVESGRLMSYVLPAPEVARRTRITWNQVWNKPAWLLQALNRRSARLPA